MNKHLSHRDVISKSYYSVCAETDKILAPLKKLYPINYFNYDRRYHDGRWITLTNRFEWKTYCAENDLYKTAYLRSELSSLCDRQFFWDDLNENAQGIFQIAKEKFKMNNGFTLIVRSEEYTEYYHLADDGSSKQLAELLVEKRPLLEGFIFYFHQEAKSIISLLEAKHTYFYPANNIFDQQVKTQQANTKKLSFEIKKHHLIHETNLYLTEAEMKCLQTFISTGSVKKSALNIGITEKTVRAHLEKIREKLGCRTLFQLSYLAAKYIDF